MTTLMKHDTLILRRDELKARSVQDYLAFKAKRYALFRVQTMLNGGANAEPDHLQIASDLESSITDLGGVKQFAIVWDLDPLTEAVIERDKSVWQAHDEVMSRASVQLPVNKGKFTAPPVTRRKKK